MPALTPVVESLDKVPEAARPFYEQKDGKYHVILDAAPAGFVPATELATANGKVIEFRDKNIALLQEVEPLRTLKTTVGDLDVVKAKEALTKVGELEKKGVKGAEDVAALVNTAVAAALKPVTDQLTASQAATEAATKRAAESTLRTVIGEKFTKAGGKPGAIDFIIGKAKEVFTVEGDQVKAHPNKFSSTRPGEALGVDEWIITAAKENDFAFEPSGGGGANPLKGGGGALKPGQTVLQDPTPQQLGDPKTAKGIKDGTIKVQYSK